MAVAALDHLHVMVRDSRERIAVTDRRPKQHRKGDEHREQRSEVHKGQGRSHQPLRSTSLSADRFQRLKNSSLAGLQIIDDRTIRAIIAMATLC